MEGRRKLYEVRKCCRGGGGGGANQTKRGGGGEGISEQKKYIQKRPRERKLISISSLNRPEEKKIAGTAIASP